MFGKYGWIFGLVLLMAGAGWLVCWSLSPSGDAHDPAATVVRAKVSRPDKSASADVRRMRRQKVETEKNSRQKPDLSLDSEDESLLTGEMKKLYAALQSELDAGNEKAVFKHVRKMQTMDEWPDDIPLSVKLKALEALKWFGASGATEVARFLGDGNRRVVAEATESMAEMISDATLGDRGTSDIIKDVIKNITDADAIESIVMSLNDMRNSVRVDTARAIYSSGNETAVKVLNENVEFLFCDGDITVRGQDDLDAYLKANPDDPADDETYGPVPSE